MGLYIRNANIGAGSAITTQYGLLVENITGATTNLAIQTGTGTIRLGDLSGVGLRMVTADASGNLATAAIPGGGGGGGASIDDILAVEAML